MLEASLSYRARESYCGSQHQDGSLLYGEAGFVRRQYGGEHASFGYPQTRNTYSAPIGCEDMSLAMAGNKLDSMRAGDDTPVGWTKSTNVKCES